MKKALCLILALCLMLCVVGCGKEEAEEAEEKEVVVLSKGACFETSMITEKDGTKYSYTVTTLDGETMESAYCAKQPMVKPLSDEMLGIRFDGTNSTFCRYYDLKNGVVSQSYFGAFWDNGKLVAYNDFEANGCLVVRDIFDDEGYCYELKIDSTAMELIIKSSELNEDGTELTVTYTMGESGAKQTAKLPLTQSEE